MDKHEELVKKYPKLFEFAWPSVGEGWLPLLDTLCYRIKQHVGWRVQQGYTVVEDGEDIPEEGEFIHRPFFSQVKEKFGGLRAYYYGGDDYTRGLVDFAEAHSYRVCEECGNAGEEKPTSWIRTLCDDCYENLEAIKQAKRDKEKARYERQEEQND